MINILSYVGMNMQSEVCLWCLLGLVRTIFDATLFKVNANLKQVWQMSMPEELTMPVQRVLRTMISGVMLVQCFTVYVYLASYIVLLYPVFLEERPTLVLPWLLLAAVRKLLCELTSLALGLGTCVLLGPARPPCIKFVVVKFTSIMPAFYMWMLVFSYYHALKVATAFKTFPAVLPPNDNDYGLELAVRRRRTKSLLGEEQLRKKLVANFYGERTPSITNEKILRPVMEISSRINSSDSSAEEGVPEADTMKPLTMSSTGWSDIGAYEDWFGSEVMIPRDTDRILEQIVLMLLRIGAFLKKEGLETIIDSQFFSSNVPASWLQRIDCAAMNADDTDTPPLVGSSKGNTASYLRDYPHIFMKKQTTDIPQTDRTMASLKTVHSHVEGEEDNTSRSKSKRATPNPSNEKILVDIEKVSSKKRIVISDTISSQDDAADKPALPWPLNTELVAQVEEKNIKPIRKRHHDLESQSKDDVGETFSQANDDLQESEILTQDNYKESSDTEILNDDNNVQRFYSQTSNGNNNYQYKKEFEHSETSNKDNIEYNEEYVSGRSYTKISNEDNNKQHIMLNNTNDFVRSEPINKKVDKEFTQTKTAIDNKDSRELNEETIRQRSHNEISNKDNQQNETLNYQNKFEYGEISNIGTGKESTQSNTSITDQNKDSNELSERNVVQLRQISNEDNSNQQSKTINYQKEFEYGEMSNIGTGKDSTQSNTSITDQNKDSKELSEGNVVQLRQISNEGNNNQQSKTLNNKKEFEYGEISNIEAGKESKQSNTSITDQNKDRKTLSEQNVAQLRLISNEDNNNQYSKTLNNQKEFEYGEISNIGASKESTQSKTSITNLVKDNKESNEKSIVQLSHRKTSNEDNNNQHSKTLNRQKEFEYREISNIGASKESAQSKTSIIDQIKDNKDLNEENIVQLSHSKISNEDNNNQHSKTLNNESELEHREISNKMADKNSTKTKISITNENIENIRQSSLSKIMNESYSYRKTSQNKNELENGKVSNENGGKKVNEENLKQHPQNKISNDENKNKHAKLNNEKEFEHSVMSTSQTKTSIIDNNKISKESSKILNDKKQFEHHEISNVNVSKILPSTSSRKDNNQSIQTESSFEDKNRKRKDFSKEDENAFTADVIPTEEYGNQEFPINEVGIEENNANNIHCDSCVNEESTDNGLLNEYTNKVYAQSEISNNDTNKKSSNNYSILNRNNSKEHTKFSNSNENKFTHSDNLNKFQSEISNGHNQLTIIDSIESIISDEFSNQNFTEGKILQDHKNKVPADYKIMNEFNDDDDDSINSKMENVSNKIESIDTFSSSISNGLNAAQNSEETENNKTNKPESN